MRTTVRIDDDLLRELKEAANREKTSLNRMVNSTLRRGLEASGREQKRKAPYREKTYAMGRPCFDLDHALSLAAALEDEQIVAKLAARK
jgi:hypothetical protein